MSSILYYSNACQNSKRLLQKISTSSIKDDMHFICIDRRAKRQNGATYVILDNGQEILLPPTVNKVPALLLLNRGHHVLFGEEINRHIEPQHVAQQQQAVISNGEPEAFCLGGGGFSNFGVSSDNFSFLDQDAESLSAKGNGGMRQLHHYAEINSNTTIETPPDTYTADTIGEVSMEQLQQQRNMDMNLKNMN